MRVRSARAECIEVCLSPMQEYSLLGQRVEFEVGRGRKGPQAQDVRAI